MNQSEIKTVFDLTWKDFFYKKRENQLKNKKNLSFSNKVKLKRCELKLSQDTLSKNIGVSRDFIMTLENDENRNIFSDTKNYNNYYKLRKYLGIELEYPYEVNTPGEKLKKAMYDNGITTRMLANEYKYKSTDPILAWLKDKYLPKNISVIINKIENK